MKITFGGNAFKFLINIFSSIATLLSKISNVSLYLLRIICAMLLSKIQQLKITQCSDVPFKRIIQIIKAKCIDVELAKLLPPRLTKSLPIFRIEEVETYLKLIEGFMKCISRIKTVHSLAYTTYK